MTISHRQSDAQQYSSRYACATLQSFMGCILGTAHVETLWINRPTKDQSG